METHPIGLKPLGYEQITVSTTAKTLTIPSGAVRAVLVAEAQPLRYRVDGTSPTSTVGFLVASGIPFELYGSVTLDQFRTIRSGGTDSVLSVHYY